MDYHPRFSIFPAGAVTNYLIIKKSNLSKIGVI